MPTPRRRPRSAGFTAPASCAALALALAACGRVPARDAERATPRVEAPKVEAADCERWSDHTLAVVLSALDEATQECPHAMRDRMLAAVEQDRPKLRRESVSQCRRHLGEPYDEVAAGCYERAGTLPALHECRFAVAAGDDAPSDPDPFAKVRAACAKARRGEPRPSTPVRGDAPTAPAEASPQAVIHSRST